MCCLQEELSNNVGAIDNAEAAIETFLEEKKAADLSIQDSHQGPWWMMYLVDKMV